MPDASCMCCRGSEKKSRLSEKGWIHEEPVVIRAAEGETVVIESAPGNEAYLEDGEYDLDRLIDLDKQQLVIKREELLDGFRSLKEGKGSSFVPDEEYITLYESKED